MSDPRPSRARQLARAVRHTPDRVLHPWRRRRARNLVRAAAPGPFLVLCHGNICRSPYAEAVLRKRFEDRASSSRVESAGFIYPGRQPPRTALEVAAAKGFDLFNHRSRAVTEEMVRSAAVIIVMEGWQRSSLHSLFPHAGAPVLMLGDLDPAPIGRRAIQDPIEQPAHVFERVFARIDACCAELVARATEVERSATA